MKKLRAMWRSWLIVKCYHCENPNRVIPTAEEMIKFDIGTNVDAENISIIRKCPECGEKFEITRIAGLSIDELLSK